MFDLYFGAFDIVLYLIGFYVALVMTNVICDELSALPADSTSPKSRVTSSPSPDHRRSQYARGVNKQRPERSTSPLTPAPA